MFLQRENGDPFGTKRDSHVNLGPQMEAGGSVGGGGTGRFFSKLVQRSFFMGRL